MNMGELREKYQRFRQWQDRPSDFRIESDEEHTCQCCGYHYTGNFCPCCSQKAGVGRISWKSVRQGIMDIWGLGSRSLLYSLWQLLWRPGHIIGDYIDGKRQVSFPPVKMLFIIAVIYSLIFYWFFPVVFGYDASGVVETGNAELQKNMEELSVWMKKYFSWSSLILAILAVIPTWVLFHYSPRHTAHTLPEGFFIQVFLAILMIVMGFVLSPLRLINQVLYTWVSIAIYGIYYLIVYRYLFGYGLWGTLWRCGFVYISIVLFSSVLFLINFPVDKHMPEGQLAMAQIYVLLSLFLTSVVVLLVGFVINYIVTRKFRQELKQAKG